MSKSFALAAFNTAVVITKLEALGASLVMLQRVEALFKSIEGLTTDGNDH